MILILNNDLLRVNRDGEDIVKIYHQYREVWPGDNVREEDIPYLTFRSDDEQAVNFPFTLDDYFLTIDFEYSLNNNSWEKLVIRRETNGIYYLGNEITFGGNLGNLRLRASNNYLGTYHDNLNTSGSSTVNFYINIVFKNDNIPVYCDGDIRTLIDYLNFDNCDTSNAKFRYLFTDCKCLITAPELLSFSLADNCYREMFKGCTSLVNAPALPATTLSINCYYQMFKGCTSLVNAPKLLATTLSDYCYFEMFYQCTSLVNAPKLLATTLSSNCYDSMFSGCTSLVNAPALPATSLSKDCYGRMFWGCTSLVNAPKLLATTLSDYCYSQMFINCTSLVNAPALPATTLAKGCYYLIFSGCTSLVNAPKLLATTLTEVCYYQMFLSCKKLIYVKMMATDISAQNCVKNWLLNVSSTGTFVKNAAATWDESSVIPSGWTVQTATA